MFKLKRNKKGFSLIEILVAISIIAVVIVPLAMNLISGARMNNKAKKVSASTDISTSIIETMQTVNLSDIMIELNSSYKGDGAPTIDKDEYHGDVSKALLKALQDKGYDVKDVDMFETKKANNGTYQRILDKSKSSVAERLLSNNSVKNYFVGQPDDVYSFVLKNVKNGEMTIDIVADIKGLQSYDLVNITSMQHSDAFYVKQPTQNGQSTMELEVAEKFLADHQLYGKITGKNESEFKTLSWFVDNMERRIIVNIVKDTNSDAVTVDVSIEYTVPNDDVLQKSDQKITKLMGSFSTNSTAEFSKGIHVYFNPLNNHSNKNQRDTLVVNNKNDVKMPIFFIALEQDTSTGFNKMLYRPSLIVNESNNVGVSHAIVCTNLIGNVGEIPGKINVMGGQKEIVIKTIGNATTQQVLYSISLQVYSHVEDSHSATGSGNSATESFAPRKKDLLAEVEGTFIDTSEKVNINNESLEGNGSFAYARGIRRVYDGTAISGIDYGYVDFSADSQLSAVNAGKYTAIATPKIGHTWEDGSTASKVVTWEITRAPTTKVELNNDGNLTYNAQTQNGFYKISEDLFNPSTGELNENCFSGVYKAKNAGTYTATFTPDANHCWEDDGTIAAKTFSWTINKKELEITWPTGENKDIWIYDGSTHTIEPTVNGIIPGDACSYTTRDNYIKDVGHKYASIASITNSNYVAITNKEHKIQVVANRSASFELKTDANGNPWIEYNGNAQDIVLKSSGVLFLGDRIAKNANEYILIAEPMEGYSWGGEEDNFEQIEIRWKITPKEVTFTWGDENWNYSTQKYGYYESGTPVNSRPKTYQVVYDGQVHQIPCRVNGLIGDDIATATLMDDKIQNESVQRATVVALSNQNYAIPVDQSKNSCLIEITPKCIADATNYAPVEKDADGHEPFVYNGLERTGVVGTCVNLVHNKATDVAVDYQKQVITTYKAEVTPKANYAWGVTDWTNKSVKVKLEDGTIYTLQDGLPVGSKYTLIVEWQILPIQDAWYEDYIVTYTGVEQVGVSYKNADLLLTDNTTHGDRKTNVGNYIAKLRPQLNHAWESGISNKPYDIREIDVEWSIIRSSMNIPEVYGNWPIYNGQEQYPNVLVFSDFGTTSSSLEFVLRKGHSQTGQILSGPSKSIPTAVDAGSYTLEIRIIDKSFKWLLDDGSYSTEPIFLYWKILPMEITGGLTQSGLTNRWTYDNRDFTGTAKFKDGFLKNNVRTGQDSCTLTYSGNVKKNAGTYNFSVTAVSNPNYTPYKIKNNEVSSELIYTNLSMIIDKRPLTIDWQTGGATLSYDSTRGEYYGTNNKNAFKSSGKLTPVFVFGSHNPPSDNYPTPKYDKSSNVTDAGKHTSTVTGINGDSLGNYCIDSNADTQEDFVIWKDATNYGGLQDFTYNGNTQKTCAGKSFVTLGGTTSGKDANTYGATVTPNAYYYWSSYRSYATIPDTWKINKLPSGSVRWNNGSTSYTGTVEPKYYNGWQVYDKTNFCYAVVGQSLKDVTGWTSMPDITVASSAKCTYSMHYDMDLDNATSSEMNDVNGNLTYTLTSVTSTSAMKHGGTYELTCNFPGDNNVEAASQKVTITLDPFPFDASQMAAYLPTLVTAPDKGWNNIGTSGGAHVVKHQIETHGDYGYYEYGFHTSYYQLNDLTHTSSAHNIWFTYYGSCDFGQYSAQIGSVDVGKHYDNTYAAYSVVRRLTVGKRNNGAEGVTCYPEWKTHNCSPASSSISFNNANSYKWRTTTIRVDQSNTMGIFDKWWRSDMTLDPKGDNSDKQVTIELAPHMRYITSLKR